MLNTSLIEYLVHFNGSRDYFHCHDILEDCWKASPCMKKKSLEIGLIQIAVGQYHLRIGNTCGGHKMLISALDIVEENLLKITSLGIDAKKMATDIQHCLGREDFSEFNMLVLNESLLNAALTKCTQRKYIWENKDVSCRDILFKHSVRDRNDVIHARMERLRNKKYEN